MNGTQTVREGARKSVKKTLIRFGFTEQDANRSVLTLSDEHLAAGGFWCLDDLLVKLHMAFESQKTTLENRAREVQTVLEAQRTARQVVLARLRNALQQLDAELARMEQLNADTGKQVEALYGELLDEAIFRDLEGLEA